ncbi:IclR family transcriptional regulator [Acidovorax sp. SUPP2522]|uniref:IclR family transcriptional regulator n=1 Tax=unclassified Acidovorax TaxID=2684926 RepID=UPI00234AFAD6|nr:MULTISPECIES: IclR family transcriptional regulator [unclassified Acidovorax]WCM96554.1 IclR family transcriptional regulator [Acidovorax sp. GBBC 1281]GKT20039.1 IclR family transcriptional regulator [Acidovorax sp. SUPP2522]
MSRTTDYTNAAQQRLLQLIDLLAGHELQGLAPAEIAKALNASPSVVTRDLDNLRTAGWGEQTPQGGRWRLSPHLIQISLRHAVALDTARRAFDDIVQRYSRT